MSHIDFRPYSAKDLRALVAEENSMSEGEEVLGRRGAITKVGLAALGGATALATGESAAQIKQPDRAADKYRADKFGPSAQTYKNSGWVKRLVRNPKMLAKYLRTVADSVETGSAAPLGVYKKGNPDYPDEGPFPAKTKIGDLLIRVGRALVGLGEIINEFFNP
ncbi:hypothetical protein [Sphingomonas sp.]|uniref:hypothetical protein n=1 Tax=Sphingomonas sp. TaxID=28214 RepID=UPI001EBB03A4|nr:hypothetical protein [Sphingomonas sp.]MBX3594083.1 hypothetical protein [Sphingomonas sp.]